MKKGKSGIDNFLSTRLVCLDRLFPYLTSLIRNRYRLQMVYFLLFTSVPTHRNGQREFPMIFRKALVRIIVRLLLLSSLGVAQAGCEYAATGALTGVSMGVAYLYMNVAERTVCFGMDRMGRASLLALRKMGIAVFEQSKDEGERRITAKTKHLDITIKLKEITPKSTKIKVSARNGILKDKATALEIIRQTVEAAETITHQKRFEPASTT